MRIGNNPEKESGSLVIDNYHRIVVPVYIPNFDGYFEKAFEVFKLCLESLLLTVHHKSRITIYNNNCHVIVKNYIDEKYKSSEFIDQVFHSKQNLGKVNAILAATKGNIEPLITITDADVLFKHNWQNAVEQTFIDFPYAGTVSPVPGSKAYPVSTANNWFLGFFGNASIRFEKVIDSDALRKFDFSLGKLNNLYQPIHIEKILVLNQNNKKAIMGCGHFVATLRREVFDKGSNTPAFVKISGGSEGAFIDYPNEKLGYLRLATINNYAYHMGNVTEKWMYELFESLKKQDPNVFLENKNLFKSKKFKKHETFLGKVILKFIRKSFFKEIYFRLLGLPKNSNY